MSFSLSCIAISTQKGDIQDNFCLRGQKKKEEVDWVSLFHSSPFSSAKIVKSTATSQDISSLFKNEIGNGHFANWALKTMPFLSFA